MLVQDNEVRQIANEIMQMLNVEEMEGLNALYAAVVDEDIDTIDELFKEHVQSVEGHFQTEEQMMQEANFPGLAAHKRDHDMIRKKNEKFLKRWEVLKGPNELRNFLEKDAKKWWVQHIGRFDAEAALKLGHAEEY